MKKHVGFRLDQEVLFLVKELCSLYPKLSQTDVVDMSIKKLLFEVLKIEGNRFSFDADHPVTEYLIGNYDREIFNIYDQIQDLRKQPTS